MKGRNKTAQEKRHQDLIATFGCYACYKDGIANDYILLHHTSGRTKPHAHSKVIPLCAAHHDYNSEIGLHANKYHWEAKYGKQSDIVEFLHEHFEIEL